MKGLQGFEFLDTAKDIVANTVLGYVSAMSPP